MPSNRTSPRSRCPNVGRYAARLGARLAVRLALGFASCAVPFAGATADPATDPVADRAVDPAATAVVGGVPYTLRTVADGLLMHTGRHEDMSVRNGGDIANAVVVIGERSVAVIDPGGSRAAGQALRTAIRARTDLPVSHVVLTHAHPDHVLGAAAFTDAPDTIVHERFARAHAARRVTDRARLGALMSGSAPLVPNVSLGTGASLTLALGGRTLEVRALPSAHTDHDLVVLDRNSGTLIAGDVVVGQRLPSLEGDLSGWIAVLEQMAAWPLQRIVPGHGEPAAPARLLVPHTAYLTRLRDGTRAAIERGDSLAGAVRRAERRDDDGARWRLHGLHHPLNVTRAWSQLEWE